MKTSIPERARRGRFSGPARAWVFVLGTLPMGVWGAGAQEPCVLTDAAARKTVSGVVADPSGAAVAGATVSVSCGGFRRSTTTGSDGTFAVESAAGVLVLEIQSQGFERARRMLRVAGDDRPMAAGTTTLAVARASESVTVTENPGYVAISTSTGSKTDELLTETPQSISVVTQQELQDRGVQTLNEALRYTPGVGTESYGADARLDWFTIRGFSESEYGSFRDGLRWPSDIGRIDPYGLEEVAVLKGPASVLYGQNAPGGLVNMVTKRPPPETRGEIAVQFGWFNRKQVQTDFGGPLAGNRNWLYRFTGVYRDSDTQVDFTPNDHKFAAPAFTWAPNDRTRLTILSDYQHDKTKWGQFLPADGTLFANPNGSIPVGFFASEPSFDRVKRYQYSAGYLFTHRLNDAWNLQQSFRHGGANYKGGTVYGVGLQSDLRTLNRFAYDTLYDTKVTAVDSQASTRFRTGGVSHTLLTGYDFSRVYQKDYGTFAAGPSLDVFAPVYGQAISGLSTFQDTRQPARQSGLYVQDQARFWKNWLLSLSGREDWTHASTENRLTSKTTEQSGRKFTGRAGLTYSSRIGLNPYISYSTSFLPTLGTDYYGRPYKPTTGAQQEAGLKYQPQRWNALFTASVFSLTQQNVQTTDPGNPLNNVQTGEVRVRGTELEVVATPLTGWSLHGAWTYYNARVMETTVAEQAGKHPTLVPDRTTAFSTQYTVPRGRFSGLGGGAGVRHVGVTAGSADNELMVPGYTLFDASLQSNWRHLRFDIAATNLGDRRYVAVCTGISYCNFGYARNVIGTVRYSW